VGLDANEVSEFSDAIVITPTQIDFTMLGQPQKDNAGSHVEEASGVIIINPTTSFVAKEHISASISHTVHTVDLNTANSSDPQIPIATNSSMVVTDIAVEVSSKLDPSSFTAVEFGFKDDAGHVPFEMFQPKDVAAKDTISSQTKQSSSARPTVQTLHSDQPEVQESQEEIPPNID
jgi:hypothetical protein